MPGHFVLSLSYAAKSIETCSHIVADYYETSATDDELIEMLNEADLKSLCFGLENWRGERLQGAIRAECRRRLSQRQVGHA